MQRLFLANQNNNVKGNENTFKKPIAKRAGPTTELVSQADSTSPEKKPGKEIAA
ncbi:MAG TPA: hypothetical protein VGU67_12330 [Edaphobacter sp.]|nr:hypothetical protein [Edaphobacter sp.]